MFQPDVLSPTPDPNFLRELKRIDPNLRADWGYQRYLTNKWAIERKLTPEQYFTNYTWLFESGLPRFVEQPIFDTDQPVFDEEGYQVSYRVVGTRRYDMAPEYEWVSFAERLDWALISDIKRAYAWQQNHPVSRMKFEMAREAEAKDAARRKVIKDATDAAIDEVFLDTRKRVQFGYGEARNER